MSSLYVSREIWIASDVEEKGSETLADERQAVEQQECNQATPGTIWPLPTLPTTVSPDRVPYTGTSTAE